MKGANSYNEELNSQHNDNVGTNNSGFDEPVDRGVDEFGYYPGEAEAELTAYMNTMEAQLASYTTQQLYDEIFRRMFEPYLNELKQLKDKLDQMEAF